MSIIYVGSTSSLIAMDTAFFVNTIGGATATSETLRSDASSLWFVDTSSGVSSSTSKYPPVYGCPYGGCGAPPPPRFYVRAVRSQ
jgi:hypothetical protein